MRKNFLMLIIIAILIQTVEVYSEPLIVDHNAVELYDDIPQQWIDSVKKMWVTVPGESHSKGYRIGLRLLDSIDNRFRVSIKESGTPEGPTNQYLRFSSATWGDVEHPTGWIYGYGEEDWYTSDTAINRTKASITYCNKNGLVLNAMGFGWCWDMTWQNGVGGGEDPVYRCRWAGSSVGGPDGNKRWGLDAEDSVLTGNRVCMDTYLRATQEYINHCKANGYPTKVFFTTGPVDGTSGELAYQRYLKHEHIRNYVKNSTDGILFDYADILSWSDSGEEYTISWTDLGGTYHSFQHIHPDNMLDLDGSYTEDGDHIGQRGALRLAKAMWYMLARIAGWDGILGVEEDGKFEAKDFLLRQNYPNPFHITTTISYRLPTRGYVRLTIYDFLGREIKALVDGMRESSEQKVEWDGKNTQGEQVASGIYFYQLKTSSGFISTKKMLLIR